MSAFSPVSRRALMSLLAAGGTLMACAVPASAQFDDYGYGYYQYGYAPRPWRYYEEYEYRPRPRARVAPAPDGAVGRLAAREFGLRQVDRIVRNNAVSIIDGRYPDGSRVRVIYDANRGRFTDRILLTPRGREAEPQSEPRSQPPRVARTDPADRPQSPAAPRLPPERPAGLKPPAQASAPATAIPPKPGTPEPAPQPAKPAPTEATAPARPEPSPPPVPRADPGTPAPRLVNPQDVRGTEPDRPPPLARANPAGIDVPPVTLPPVAPEDFKADEPAD